MGGQTVEFHGWEGDTVVDFKTYKIINEFDWDPSDPSGDFRLYTGKPSAFHLPEVCRQIYAETATLGYKLSTFYFSDIDDTWVTSLLPAQRDAITNLQLDLWKIDSYLDSLPEMTFRTIFPGLRRIHCSGSVLAFIYDYPDLGEDIHDGLPLNDYMGIICDWIKDKEGEDVQVIFY